ncbi:MAG: hypothetical protein Q9198_003821 [Flavoplaca austrocitrina]
MKYIKAGHSLFWHLIIYRPEHSYIKATGKPNSLPMHPTVALSDIQSNPNIWYRVQVLLYDLSNVGNDVQSEKQLSATTNELYISAPYFTDAEASQILSTLVEPSNLSKESIAPSPNVRTTTIQDAIHQRLANFFDKRKANGDSRPCGPHDMLPIYLDVFKLQRGDLKKKKFLARLRRSGLEDLMSKCENSTTDARVVPMDNDKKGERGKKGY